MQIFLNILMILAIVATVTIGFGVLNIYVLNKVKINKWIVLVIAILLLCVPAAVTMISGQVYLWVQIITSILVGICVLWFIELFRTDKYTKKHEEKKIVIKPKAKPNRAKQFKNNNK